MAHIHQVVVVLVGFIHERVDNGSLAQIGLGKFETELVEFADERGCGVESVSFGIGNFQLVVHKHVDIFVESLGLKLLGVVFVIKIFEFALMDWAIVNGHEHRVAVGGGADCQNRYACECCCDKSLFHCWFIDDYLLRTEYKRMEITFLK